MSKYTNEDWIFEPIAVEISDCCTRCGKPFREGTMWCWCAFTRPKQTLEERIEMLERRVTRLEKK